MELLLKCNQGEGLEETCPRAQGLAQNLASKHDRTKYLGIAENGVATQGQPGGRPGGEMPQGLAQNLARLSVKPQGTNGQVNK